MSQPSPSLPTRTVVMPDGGRLTIPDDLRLMTPYVLQEQGDWFEDEIHFVRRWLQPGMQVVDVGANYGMYTCAAARAVGAAGKVWSFEPAGLPHACLAQSVCANGWSQVVLQQVALSDHSGTARLGINDNAELNSLSQSGGAGEEVVLSTLDAQDAAFGPIDFLKLDAEGEEIRILQASAGFFARHDPLVMFEFKHGPEVNTGLIEAIRAFGMEVYRLVPGLGVLTTLETDRPGDAFMLNLFGCRPARAAQLAAAGFLATAAEVAATAAAAPTLPAAEQTVGAWIAARPWAKTFWPRGQPTQRSDGHELHLCGMAELLAAEDPARLSAERLARLIRAVDLLQAAWSRRSSVARGFALARAQGALGRRADSMHVLQSIGQIFVQRKTAIGYRPDELLIPADARHDDLAPLGNDPGLVIRVMLDEPFLERSAYSAYFNGEQIGSLVQHISRNPLTTEPVRRRIAAFAQR